MLIEWIQSVPSAVESEMKALLLQLACRFSTVPVDEVFFCIRHHITDILQALVHTGVLERLQ